MRQGKTVNYTDIVRKPQGLIVVRDKQIFILYFCEETFEQQTISESV